MNGFVQSKYKRRSRRSKKSIGVAEKGGPGSWLGGWDTFRTGSAGRCSSVIRPTRTVIWVTITLDWGSLPIAQALHQAAAAPHGHRNSERGRHAHHQRAPWHPSHSRRRGLDPRRHFRGGRFRRRFDPIGRRARDRDHGQMDLPRSRASLGEKRGGSGSGDPSSPDIDRSTRPDKDFGTRAMASP